MSVIYDIGGTSNNCFSINGKANILQGDEEPKNIQGQNGDIYLQSVGRLWSKRNGLWQAVESSTASWPLPTKNNQLVTVSPSETGFTVSYTDEVTAEDFTDIAYKSRTNTFTNKNTFSNSNTFSGTNTFSNSNTFSGTNTFTNKNTFSEQIVTTKNDFLRSKQGNYGIIYRNDGSNYYILLTNSGDQDGSWNSLRPYTMNLSNGNITFATTCTFSKTIQGTALNALWGDLAEFYESDNEYPKGTLVKFGGDKEITIADDEVNAVVTSQPGVLLNGQMENGVAIALCGRVPVRTIGKVKKFDYLTLSEIPGVARALEDKEFSMNVVARALEDKDTEEEDLVLCVVKFDI